MKLLPVALNVAGKRCLVVGGGSVAERKVRACLECGALVIVVSPVLNQGLTTLRERIEWREENYSSSALHEYFLVFACTNRREINAQVAHDACEAGVWCNLADDPQSSDFHAAATLRRGEITIGITTGGGSPSLSRHLKARVETAIGDEYSALLEMMSARRLNLRRENESQANGAPSERAAMWRAVLKSDALELLRFGKRMEAETVVDDLMAQWKRKAIGTADDVEQTAT